MLSSPLPPDVLRLTIGGYTLDPFGTHGLGHWARALENGLNLVRVTGADPLVVTLFALLHDCRRWSEGSDWDHGLRASYLVPEVCKLIPGLDMARAELLREACAHHTDGVLHDDPTVGTCWDADRLDLGRVGITPRPELLCTAAARAPSEIEGATQRAVAETVPSFVYEEWVQFTL